MDRRIATVGVVVFLLSAVIVVQVLDPQFGERRPPEVDFSEPPAEIAADAATQFEYVDYSYRIDIADKRGGEWEQVRVMQIDHSDHEYYKAGPLGDRGVVLYGTDAITFVRPGSSERWRVTSTPETAYPALMISQPLATESFRGANISIVTDNESYLLIHVEANPLKIIGDYPGSAEILVNRETGLVEKVLVQYYPRRSESRYMRFQIREVNASVHRPQDIPFSPREAIWDILRGPLFRF